jgi:hypothetical protein
MSNCCDDLKIFVEPLRSKKVKVKPGQALKVPGG